MKKYVDYQYRNQIKDWDWEYAQHPIMNLADQLGPHFDYIIAGVNSGLFSPEFLPIFGQKDWLQKTANSSCGDFTAEELKEWCDEYPDIVNGHGHKFLRDFKTSTQAVYSIFSNAFQIDAAELIVRVQVEEPGHFYPVHLDRMTLLTNHNDKSQYDIEQDNKTHRVFIVPFRDRAIGQMMQMGKNFVDWKSGDVISFNFRNVPHCTCNVGYESNFMFVITAPSVYNRADW